MASRVILVRHGQTEWTMTGRHTGRTDIPLTELGRTQAHDLGSILDKFEFELILSSPAERAHETARIAGYGDAIVEADLGEWDYGIYEGKRTVDTRQEIPAWSVWTHDIIGGESLDQLGARCDRVIRLTGEASGPVALFGHGHALRVLAARWLHQDPRLGAHLVFDTAATSVLGFERENPAIIHWNEVCHDGG